MADPEYVKSAKYEYRPASNLVLESDAKRGRNNEPSGEAETLVGKLGNTRMGDRVARARPAELEERREKARLKRERAAGEADAEHLALKRGRRPGAAAAAGGAGAFLDQLEHVEGVTYRPRTKESRAVYEQLLGIAARALGDQPHEILAGAAEEVLAILKSDELREPAKKAKISELLGRTSDDEFNRLVLLARSVNDFHAGGSGAAGASGNAPTLDEAVGVAVVFDDDEGEDGDDDGGALGEVADDDASADDSDDDGGDGAAADDDAALAAAGLDAEDDAGAAGGDEVDEAAGLVPVHKIDAFWLQRELNKASGGSGGDAEAASTLAAGVLAALHDAVTSGAVARGDLREAENRLVALLDYGQFDLVKTLLRNAARIYYVTRLRQAQTDGEREAVRAEMRADTGSGGAALLEALDRTQTSESWAADRTHNVTARVRREARAMMNDARMGAATAGRGAGVGAGAAATTGVGIFASDVDTEEFSSAGTATVVPGARASTAVGTSGAAPAALPAMPTTGGGKVTPLEMSAGGATTATAASSTTAAAAPALVNLESLAFTAGGHLMSNKRVELPDKSWRSQKKGYEEVHVPALKATPLAPGEVEVPITDLPPWAQPAFKGMTKLNRVQSRLYGAALFSPENLLLCAPTGAGKTNVAVLTILHELGLHRTPPADADDDAAAASTLLDTSAFKIVYVAPMKALVQEVVANLSQRLTGPYGLVVRELSGDINLTKAEIAETQIIVTTPEKWDVITRKAGDRAYTQLVRLLIIDEVRPTPAAA